MSVNALKPTLSAIRADGHLTLDEVKTLTNPNNGLGVNTDNDEFEVFKRLSADVKVGNQLKNVTPDVVKEINDKNKERLVHKGVKIGGAVGGGVGGTAFVAVAATVIGLAAAAGGYAILGVFWAVPVALGIGAAIAGIAVGIGALAGYIRSRRNPITASEIKRKSPLALAAAQFKKNPLVQRGVKIAGILGATISGVFAVGGITAIVGAAIGGAGLAGGAAAVGFSALLFGAPVLGACIGGVAILIGLGALGGYIHSKIKASREKDIPAGPVTADAEAAALIEETVETGATAKDPVKKGAKIGGIVGGVLGGLGFGGWALGTTAASIAGGAGAGLMAGGFAFVPVGLAVIAAIGVCVGFGALCGFIHSKVKKQKD